MKKGLKKLLSLITIASVLSVIFISPAYAVEKDNSITVEEFNSLMVKYNIIPEYVVNGSVSEDLIKSLTKDELESLIIKGQNPEPMVVNSYNVSTYDQSQLDQSFINKSSDVTTSAATGWITRNMISSLSSTVSIGGTSDFLINGSAAASYRYDYLPGYEGYRNMWFTGATDGGSVQVNSPNTGYVLKEVLSSSVSFNDTTVTKTARYKYNYGIYVEIGGQPVGIPISTGLEVTVNFYWYLADQPKPWWD